MKTVIYTRVSRDAKREARSVTEQEAECRAWADREGWDVEQAPGGAYAWSDNDRSASRYARKDREQWQSLMFRLEQGGIDLLLVWEPSRATRDRRVWAALAATCEQHGIKIGCNGHVYDLEDPEEAFQLDLFFALAARESGVTRKRVNRSVRASAVAGRPHGRILYGYRRTYDSKTGALVAQLPDDDLAPVVLEAGWRVRFGETPYAIAQDFNARGIEPPSRAPRGWELTQIKRLAVNPGYFGQRVHQGKVIGDATWPAIHSEATYLACVARLSDPKRRTQRDSSIAHLLSGIAVCGRCDGRVRSQKARGYRTYLCVDNFCVSRVEELTDAVVVAAVVGRLKDPALADLMAHQSNHAAVTVRAAHTAAKELRDRLEGFYAEAAKGGLSPAALGRMEAALLPQIEKAERSAELITLSPVLSEVAGPGAEAKWKSRTLTQKREIIRELATVRLLPSAKRGQRFKPESVEVKFRKSVGE